VLAPPYSALEYITFRPGKPTAPPPARDAVQLGGKPVCQHSVYGAAPTLAWGASVWGFGAGARCLPQTPIEGLPLTAAAGKGPGGWASYLSGTLVAGLPPG